MSGPPSEPYLQLMTQRGRPADPLSTLAAGMRQIGRLDLGDIRRGLANLANPSAVGLLNMLGSTRQERVETMATMLRNSSEADIAELGDVFGLAMAKLAEEQALRPFAVIAVAEEGRQHRRPANRPRRRRGQTAAEWRTERRLA